MLHILVAALFAAPELADPIRWRLGMATVPTRGYADAHAGILASMDANAGEVGAVFLGDSHVQRMNVGAIVPAALNLGISGDTVRQLRSRIVTYNSVRSARQIVLLAGTNDLLERDPDEIAADMRAILASLPDSTSILLASPPPAGRSHTDGLAPERIDELAALYAELCRSPCRFVDLRSRLRGDDAYLAPEVDAGDGIHLDRRGYEIVAAALAAGLNGAGQ